VTAERDALKDAFLARAGLAGAQRERLAGDASTRAYERRRRGVLCAIASVAQRHSINFSSERLSVLTASLTLTHLSCRAPVGTGPGIVTSG
jgi:hypothetical protein